MWTLGGLAVLVMVLDGVTSSDKSASATNEAPGSEGASRAKVAAAPADPFNPYQGVNDEADTERSEGAYDSGEDDPTDTDVDDVSDATWQDMLTVAQNVAPAYSTYDSRMTAQEYVATVPSLAPKFRKSLEARAVANWPSIREHQVVSSAKLIGTAPDLIYYRESAGTAQIAVSVAQTTTSEAPGAEKSESTRSVVLVLIRSAADDGTETWTVTDILS